MALEVRVTGADEFSGETPRVKVAIVAHGSVGKSRYASYYPKPIFAVCGPGVDSIADRAVPYVVIKSAMDMLNLLLALEENDVDAETLVVDCGDDYARIIQDDWLSHNPGEQVFRGYAAYDYLDARLDDLLNRLLTLDKNVVLLFHPQEHVVKVGVGADESEHREFEAQIRGSVKQRLFNDFRLVGHMYVEEEEGEQVRYLDFRRNSEWPMLKDNFNLFPEPLPVMFAEVDFDLIQGALIDRRNTLGQSAKVGEITQRVTDSSPTLPKPAQRTAPAQPPQGPVAPVGEPELPLESMDKPSLQVKAREMGLQIPNNALKKEIIDEIRAHIDRAVASQPTEEVVNPEVYDAIENIRSTIGAAVVEDDEPSKPSSKRKETTAPEPEQPAETNPWVNDPKVCGDCGKDLSTEKSPDLVRFASIKYGTTLCNEDYLSRTNGGK